MQILRLYFAESEWFTFCFLFHLSHIVNSELQFIPNIQQMEEKYKTKLWEIMNHNKSTLDCHFDTMKKQRIMREKRSLLSSFSPWNVIISSDNTLQQMIFCAFKTVYFGYQTNDVARTSFIIVFVVRIKWKYRGFFHSITSTHKYIYLLTLY